MKVRIAAVQYLLRSISDWDGFENQVRFMLKAAAEYKPNFVMPPEIFTSQLLSFLDTENNIKAAVRRMHDYTPRYQDLMAEMAKKYGFLPDRRQPPQPAGWPALQHFFHVLAER